MILYVATSNPGKLRDFSFIAGEEFSIQPLPGLATIPSPPEDELTFEGNARVKALAYSAHAPGAIVLADDSGLEVDALAGAPGVRSARYSEDAGFSPSQTISLDEQNNLCLLNALKSTPANERQARYRCVLAAARDSQVLAVSHGDVEGKILTAPQGTSGFGYDPLFFLSEYDRTMAELTPEERLGCSHRGRAFRALLPLLRGL